MPDTPTVRLIARLEGVDDLNRILAVCHLTFTLNCTTRLKHRIITVCELNPDDLDHLWLTVDELALQDAMIMFGAPEEQAESMDSLWNLWGRLVARYLTVYPLSVFEESFGELERTFLRLTEVRRQIVAMGEASDDSKEAFIGSLRNLGL